MGKVNLSPESYSEGGGLLSDVDVEIVNAIFRCAPKTDYRETCDVDAADAVPVLDLEVRLLDEEDEEKTQHLIFSMGSIARMTPSANGRYLQPSDAHPNATIQASSNGAIFLSSLAQAGYSLSEASDDIRVLKGLKIHILRVKAPARPGLKREEGKREPEVTQVTSLLGGGKAKKKVAKDEDEEEEAPVKRGPGRPRKVKPEPEEDEDEEEEEAEEEAEEETEADPTESEAEKYLQLAIKGAKNKLKLDDVYQSVFELVKKMTPKQRKPLLAFVSDEEWVTSEDRPWSTSENGVLFPGPKK